MKSIFKPIPAAAGSGIPFSQPSIIVPTESWASKPSSRLIDIALEAIQHARLVDHSDIVDKMEEYPHWPNMWPGEHYKLLSGLMQALKPRTCNRDWDGDRILGFGNEEIHVAQGKIITFDIVPWREFPKCILEESDFNDGRLEQVVADLTDNEIFHKYSNLLARADFIFIDAAKVGIQEQMFIDKFKTLVFRTCPIFMFDDIRLLNMIKIWNDLDKPKLDLTSFGLWAGTGLVDWTSQN